MEGGDYIIEDFSEFYLRQIYLFKYSTHTFDNENSISRILDGDKILDKSIEIKNYSFVDSQTNQLIQLSDVFVGLMGKLAVYFNTSTKEKIDNDFCSLSMIQRANIDLLIDVIEKSDNKNIGFLHSIDGNEERSKMDVIREKRKTL